MSADGDRVTVGRLYFRVIERDDGSWARRRGVWEIDSHADMDEAMQHIATVADEHRPSEIFVHHPDGRVSSVATLD